MPNTKPDPWIALYRAHVTPLYRAVSKRVGGDRALVEDLVQEAWLAALSTWQQPPDAPLAWLLTCAMNRYRNHLRRVKAEPLPPPGELWSALAEQAGPIADTSSAWLQHALARIRPAQADLIEEHHLDGASLAEMATRRRLSVRAVEGRLARARKALKNALRSLDSQHLDNENQHV